MSDKPKFSLLFIGKRTAKYLVDSCNICGISFDSNYCRYHFLGILRQILHLSRDVPMGQAKP